MYPKVDKSFEHTAAGLPAGGGGAWMDRACRVMDVWDAKKLDKKLRLT